MGSPARILEGTVLRRDESGENRLHLRLFAKEEGLLHLLKPLSSKRVATALPDLFDDLEVRLSRLGPGGDSSGPSFVSEWRTLRPRPELARGRERLEAASALSRFYLENGAHLAEPQPAARLLGLALDSLAAGHSPPAVLLKTFYRFARMEGYPAKESWRRSLPAEAAARAAQLLHLSLQELQPENLSHAPGALDSLRLWLNAETELRA